MANPEDTIRQEGDPPPGGRPRRQPPTIDMKAVEVSPDGPAAASAASGSGAGSTSATRALQRILASLPSTKFAVIGSVCAVAVMVAAALWIYLTSAGVDGSQRNAVSPEAAKPDDVIERVSKLEAILKALPAQPSPDAVLANRIAALEATLTPLATRIAALEDGLRDNADATRNAGKRAETAAGLFDELKKSGAEQNSLQQRERSTLEDLANRLKTLEGLEATLYRKQEELDRAANAKAAAAPDKALRIVMIALALRGAVERDDPFTAELDAARSFGLDERALAALEPFAATGVPTRNELFRSLSAQLPELLRVSAPASHDGGYLERLQASAAKMMNIRPARDEPGDDPATVIGRVELKMARQDIAGVMTELDKLPAPAKDLAQPWREKALARQGALEAARLIVAASLAKLGEPAVREPSPQ